MMRRTVNELDRVLDGWLRRVRLFLQRHLGYHGDLKVLSLVIAVVVFSLIRLTIGHPETFSAPVEASILEEGVAILQYTPTEVEVELKGAAEEVRNFDAAELKVQLIIETTREEGGEVFKLTRRNVAGAGKLRVVRITPPEVRVEYDREVGMTMRLSQPELTGRPLQGEASVKLVVDTVNVRGSESQLNKLVEKSIRLPTETVDVSGRTQGFVRRVKVLPPDDSGISHVIPAEVEARVMITIQPPPESIYTNLPMPTATSRPPAAVRAPATNQVKTKTKTKTKTEAAESATPAPVEAALPGGG